MLKGPFFKKRLVNPILATPLPHHKSALCSQRRVNHIPLKWVPFWHAISFSPYLRHCFRSESEEVKGNRVNEEWDEYIFYYRAAKNSCIHSPTFYIIVLKRHSSYLSSPHKMWIKVVLLFELRTGLWRKEGYFDNFLDEQSEWCVFWSELASH